MAVSVKSVLACVGVDTAAEVSVPTTSVLILSSSVCEVGCSSFRWTKMASSVRPWSINATTCSPDCR